MGIPVAELKTTDATSVSIPALDAVCQESAKTAAQKRLISGEMLEGNPEKEEKLTPAKKRKTKDSTAPEAPEVVLVDGGEPQVRTWRICSEKLTPAKKRK